MARESSPSEFERWARSAWQIAAAGSPVAALDADPSPSWTAAEFFNVHPARFLRDAIGRLLEITPRGFEREHPELVGFVQDPRRRGLSPRYQAYLVLFHGPVTREIGYSAQLNPLTGATEELVELAEPPFAVVLSLAGETALETTNVTEFAQLSVDETCIVDLDLLNGFAHTPFPADFRTKAALARDRAAERRAA